MKKITIKTEFLIIIFIQPVVNQEQKKEEMFVLFT